MLMIFSHENGPFCDTLFIGRLLIPLVYHRAWATTTPKVYYSIYHTLSSKKVLRP
jgi:hypothetical protein